MDTLFKVQSFVQESFNLKTKGTIAHCGTKLTQCLHAAHANLGKVLYEIEIITNCPSQAEQGCQNKRPEKDVPLPELPQQEPDL
jgi:hypothetical protein